jgi:colicin import membrane protein
MALATLRERPDRQALSSIHPGEKRLWGWLSFSLILHVALITALFLIPNIGGRKARPFPVYTVELVGGEKLGGAPRVLEPPAAAPNAKPEKKAKSEPPPQAPAVEKKEPEKKVKKAPEPPVKTKEVMKEIEKSPEKAEPAKGLSDDVREKLIQSALEGVKRRVTQTSQKSAEPAAPEKKASKETGGQPVLSGPAEGPGAAAPGQGGTGGGIVKGVEFIVYRNRIFHQIKDRWTWIGKRSDLEVTVRFGIQDNGEVFGLKITQSSGDASFDSSVLRAVRSASPLGSPPESYRADFRDVEIIFRPKDLRS